MCSFHSWFSFCESCCCSCSESCSCCCSWLACCKALWSRVPTATCRCSSACWICNYQVAVKITQQINSQAVAESHFPAISVTWTLMLPLLHVDTTMKGSDCRLFCVCHCIYSKALAFTRHVFRVAERLSPCCMFIRILIATQKCVMHLKLSSEGLCCGQLCLAVTEAGLQLLYFC